MDEIDRKLLALLQEDATLSVAQMAERVGLSPTPCWKRMQKLEATGVIARRVALVDPDKVGMGLTVLAAHSGTAGRSIRACSDGVWGRWPQLVAGQRPGHRLCILSS